jgi:hypothetical protein
MRLGNGQTAFCGAFMRPDNRQRASCGAFMRLGNGLINSFDTTQTPQKLGNRVVLSKKKKKKKKEKKKRKYVERNRAIYFDPKLSRNYHARLRH